MAYHVTKDLKAEVKVSGSLFLKDLLILVLYPTIMWFFTGGLVADTLKIPYIICDTPTRVLANWRGFLRHGGTPQRTFTSPLHPVTGLPLSRLLGGFLF